jgi:hypothetical protein
MNLYSHIRRASLPPRLAFAFFLLALFPVTVLSQKGERARVIDSILGVGIGTKLEKVHEKLDRLSTRKAHSTREEEAREEEEQEREGGRKEAWYLRTTDYATVALKTDREGRVVWITGWLRPGREIAFGKLGNLSSALGVTESRAVWNVATPTGGYRVVAKGQNGKARIISLLSLATSPVQ